MPDIDLMGVLFLLIWLVLCPIACYKEGHRQGASTQLSRDLGGIREELTIGIYQITFPDGRPSIVVKMH